MSDKSKVLIFIVAYHASSRLVSVLKRIPDSIAENYDVEVLIIDDFSKDDTFELGLSAQNSTDLPFKMRVLQNSENLGYGGNQKLGYHYAIKYKFDYVVLLHGDGQYAPEVMPELLDGVISQNAGAGFGSRMLSGQAMKGGMPAYKFVGNKILSAIQNKLLGVNLSEFHSGYRVYKVKELAALRFELNTNDFHFDTQIIIQLIKAKAKIIEIPIPTYYGDEICHVDGIKYAFDVLISTLRAKAQDYHILYDRRYDFDHEQNTSYVEKREFLSPHRFVLDYIDQQRDTKILDIGCAGGYVGHDLAKNGAQITGVDMFEPDNNNDIAKFYKCDLDQGLPSKIKDDFDYVLLLDIIEHLKRPEQFMIELRVLLMMDKKPKVIISTGNVGFIIIRFMLLFGQFNYGKKGILDITHTRLFTFRTLKSLLEQCGYRIIETKGIPVPFPLAMGDNGFSRSLIKINQAFIALSKTVFAYQMIMVAEPTSDLEKILDETEQHTKTYLDRIEKSNANN